jgi:hypothetical protein
MRSTFSSCNKSQRDALFLKFILVKNSTWGTLLVAQLVEALRY